MKGLRASGLENNFGHLAADSFMCNDLEAFKALKVLAVEQQNLSPAALNIICYDLKGLGFPVRTIVLATSPHIIFLTIY